MGEGLCESQSTFKIFDLEEENTNDLQDTPKIRIFGEKGGRGGDSFKNEAPAHTIKKSSHPGVEGGGGGPI